MKLNKRRFLKSIDNWEIIEQDFTISSSHIMFGRDYKNTSNVIIGSSMFQIAKRYNFNDFFKVRKIIHALNKKHSCNKLSKYKQIYNKKLEYELKRK